jgi:S-adenosylmethionine hydrolase
MSSPIISFSTDFATLDGYVGAVRGVILSICPEARIFDISHHIPPQDVSHAAFMLHTAARFYPEGTIHLAVVDPAVGTRRRALCLKTEKYLFVGPDNGIFSPFLDEKVAAYSLDNDAYWREHVSVTFHGRDIFGPVAAHLAKGLDPAELGPKVRRPVRLDSWRNRKKNGRIEGAIVHIDHFGNCITSFSSGDLAAFKRFQLWIAGNTNAPETRKLKKTYADAPLGEPCWLIGSTGLVELAINGGNAAEVYGIERGDQVFIEPRR